MSQATTQACSQEMLENDVLKATKNTLKPTSRRQFLSSPEL
jgi:hypothetical protein